MKTLSLLLCLTSGLFAQVVTQPGGAVSNPSTNGIAYWNNSTLTTTATGGAGTLCLTSVSGATPVFGSCAGSAATAWSAVTTGTNATALLMGTGGSLSFSGTGTINANLLNGTALTGLATGILKNTTSTGVPSIAVAGDFPTLNQSTTGTAANITGVAAAANGGTGVANTATHTLGTSNQNWATLGTGIVKNTTTTGALSDAASTDVIGLWTGSCTSSTFLRGDGACQAPTGTGTVTTFSAGTLSPVFTTSVATATSTPALTFTLSNAGAGTVFGNNTGSAAAPAYTAAPVLGLDNTTAGTLQLANGSAAFHSILTSGATANNTIKLFATVPTTGDLVDCVTASTTCTLTDSGVLAANVVNASSPGAGVAHFAGSTQTVTSSAVALTDIATEAADTVVMNATASTAAPTAVAMPTTGTNGCAGTSNALIYNTSTHALGCNTLTGTGSVTSFSAGTLSPLFTTSVATATSTPALTFTLSNAGAGTVFGNNTGSSGAPAYTAAVVLGVDNTTAGTIQLANSAAAFHTVIQSLATASYNFNLPATAGTSGTALLSGGGAAAANTWTPYTLPATIASGAIPYASSSSALTTLASTGYSILASGATNPAWITPTANGQCLMSGASSYATTTPSFQTCPTWFTSPMTTLGDIIYENATPAAARLAGPTSPNGIPQTLTNTPAAGAAAAEVWSIPGVAIDAQTGTTFTVPVTDDVHFITASNVSATAWTGFTLANNYAFSFENINTGLVTYTPATGTVNGNATQIVPQNWFGFHYTDNTNTFMPVMPTFQAFPNCQDSSGNHLNFNSTTGALSCGTTDSHAGTVTTFSAGTLSPLFTTSVATATTTPALTFTLSTAAGGTVLGNNTSSAAGPIYTNTPVLGVDNSTAGSLQLANGSAAFHSILGSAATANNTVNLFATAPTTGDLVKCVTASTTCTLTDSGVLAANVVNASAPGAGVAHFAGSTQTVTSSAVALSDMATQAADTVVMNATASTAAPTAVAMPTTGTNGCAGTANALTYNTSSHALGCNTIAGSGTVNTGTASHLAYYATSTTAVSDMGADLVFNGTHTLTGSASLIFDVSAATGANVKLPAGSLVGGNALTLVGALTTAGAFTTTGAFTTSITQGGNITLTLPTTSATMARTDAAQSFTGTQTIQNELSVGGTAYSYGAPSTTGAAALLVPATTYTVTGSSTTANFQANYYGIPTFTDALAGTITDAFNTLFNGPPVAAGAGPVVFTRAHTLGIVDSTSAASSITGGLVISTTLGTTATSVGIGGGNVNAGGNGVFGGTLLVTGHVTLEGVTSTGAAGSGKLLFDSGSTPTSMTLTNATGLPISGVVSATGAIATIANGNNPLVINCALTSGTTCLTTGETTAATTAGAVEHQITTLTTTTAIPLQITQGAAGPANSAAPNLITISAAAAGGAAGASNAGSAGAAIGLLTGAGSAGGATTGIGGAGGAFTMTQGAGGAAGGTSTNNGGAGGGLAWTTGAGGNGGSGVATAGSGGGVTWTLGAPGTNSSSGTAGAVGQFQITGNAAASTANAAGVAAGTVFNLLGIAGGASSNAAGTAGIGSIVSINSGIGGAGTGTNAVGGAGGGLNLTSGNGGASLGTGANANGGNITLTLGKAGIGGSGAAGVTGEFNVAGTAIASSSGTAGLAAGTLFLVSGLTGGASSNAAGTAGIGSAATINSGIGGAGTGTNAVGGAGGNINLTAGAGGASLGTGVNSNGGNLIFTPGAAGTGGSGTAGLNGTFQIAGSTAGFAYYAQGTANTTANSNVPANSIIEQAPTSVTAYTVTKPGAAPVNNFSAKTTTTAGVESYSKMGQSVILTGSAYTNATTSFTNVASTTNLNFALDASTAYAGECYLVYSASAATAGPKVEFTGPASPTAVNYSSQFQLTTTPTYADSAAASAFSTSQTGGTAVTGSTLLAVRMSFGIVNGTNAGTLQLLAAANGSGTLTIEPGSWCQLQ